MSDRQAPLGVTRLLGLNLTPGKLRGLQRISNSNGTLTMVALDQNSSMISMIKESLKKKGEEREPTYEEIVEAKVMLARALSPRASAILVDAYYGVWNTVASFSLPRDVGLLVRVEKSGGEKNRYGAPLGAIEPGWSVAKIKRIGADAVKLLAQFEPTERDSAEHQFALIQHVYEECQKHDILMLLETVAFPFGGEKKD
ncbi:MAG: tagatose-bisphosphate aldolase, partial [Gemmataceae bacterium]|nr:tagatose-bisphosphate aldolase [Gemmataceae bacterium]